jgi:hypothetical protein
MNDDQSSSPIKIALTTLVVAAISCLFVVVFLVATARAHEAIPTASQPLGWTYPWSCCSGMDCRVIGDTNSTDRVHVIEAEDGYRFTTSTEVIPYNDKKIKESPDGLFHWCTKGGKDDSDTICLFVPPKGF